MPPVIKPSTPAGEPAGPGRPVATSQPVPDLLKVFTFHGLDLGPVRGKPSNWTCECPSCGKTGKFDIKAETGVYLCFSCGFKGNPVEFLRWLSTEGLARTGDADYEFLRAMRKLLSRETPREWGAFLHPLTGEWVIPGYSSDGRLVTLYVYRQVRSDEKPKLLCTPNPEGAECGGHGIGGLPLLDALPPDAGLDVCEGAWDGMAWWEAARLAAVDKSGVRLVADPAESHLARRGVISIPGANVFKSVWADVCGDRDVNLFFHNDHPKVNPRTGKAVEGAGETGTKRVVGLLAAAERMPTNVASLRWAKEGSDLWHDPDRPSGYDLRDWLSDAGPGAAARARAVGEILARVRPVPPEWVPGNDGDAPAGRMELKLERCESWKEVERAGIKALRWSEPYSRGLATIFAAVVSTKQGGDDQLWIKLQSPPASGKTTLAEAVSVNRRYVHPESKFQSMFSGYRDGSDTDYSLVARLRDKTFIIKEGDSLLSNAYRDVILGQLRDIYDRITRNSYGHNLGTEHAGLNISLVVCGTKRLDELDESDLGDRFLTVKMLDRVSEEDRREMMIRGIYAMANGIKLQANGTAESQDGPERLQFKRLCGGYVTYLRENAERLYACLEPTPEQVERLADMADMVAIMRTRAATDDVTPVTELPTRLAKQLTRLAFSYAAALGRTELDDQVMRWTFQAMEDTSHGLSHRICRKLVQVGKSGMTVVDLANDLSITVPKCRDHLLSMQQQDPPVVQKVTVRVRAFNRDGTPMEGLAGEPVYKPNSMREVYRLTPRMSGLWARVYELGTAEDEDTIEEGE